MDYGGKLAHNYRRALVTGGAGFIGSHLIDELVRLGLEVISIDDFSAGKEENISHLYKAPGFKSVRADVTNLEQIKPHFEGVDVVFHQACSKNAACMRNPARDLEVNAKGTLNVLQCCHQAGVVKVVHASTGSVYGKTFQFPTKEEHPLNPVSYYGISKLAGEKYAILFHTLHGLDVTVLRYYHVYGPRQDNSDEGGVVAIFCRRAHEGKNLIIFGDGTQVRSFTHVSDVVRINLLAAVTPEMNGRAYNCASGVRITVQELAETVLKYCDRPELKIEYKPWKPGDVKNFHVDNSRLCGHGFEFHKDFEEGLTETIAWTNQFITGQD